MRNKVVHLDGDQRESKETSFRLLTGWQLLCFNLLTAPLAMINFAVVSFMKKFYAVGLGLGLSAVGAVFMFGQAFDIATNPIVCRPNARPHVQRLGAGSGLSCV